MTVKIAKNCESLIFLFDSQFTKGLKRAFCGFQGLKKATLNLED